DDRGGTERLGEGVEIGKDAVGSGRKIGVGVGVSVERGEALAAGGGGGVVVRRPRGGAGVCAGRGGGPGGGARVPPAGGRRGGAHQLGEVGGLERVDADHPAGEQPGGGGGVVERETHGEGIMGGSGSADKPTNGL